MNKLLPALLLSSILSAFVLGGCSEPVPLTGVENTTPVSGENQETMEDNQTENSFNTEVQAFELKIDNNEEQNYETTLNFSRIKGTYEYKGLRFEGEYSRYNDAFSGYVENFYLDTKSLSDEPGLSLYNAALQIANAFSNNDIKELRKHFGSEEDFNRMIERHDIDVESPVCENTLNLKPYNVNAYDDGHGGFLFMFLSTPENPDMESGIFVYVYMYLNENGEWKTTSIGTD